MLTGRGQTSILGGLQGQRTKVSINRPIDCLLSCERLFLKEFNDEVVTDWSSRLFHTLTTLWEKKYNLMSRRQRFFSSLRGWPLVRRLLSSSNKSSNGIVDRPVWDHEPFYKLRLSQLEHVFLPVSIDSVYSVFQDMCHNLQWRVTGRKMFAPIFD